jgi:aspartyl-tRNA(Asn)/glutamyl-tRNA(Gln) amidotransferase subunit B
MSEYRPTIGLEIHAELRTKTKMFCACANDPDVRTPNSNICPVCMAHPGTLPVINKEAVHKVLLVGTALGARLADYTEFDRKSYFYPDIPKGYQLSQYAYPLVQGGALRGIDITRVHLEEDTARSQHAAEGRDAVSLVDYNRAGVPLMELVTEPVIHSAVDAGAFARELQLLLRCVGASHANMEKGEMRVEANISVSKTDVFGTKVEVKNLNSFRSVERAIFYEVERQIALLEKGVAVLQETRGWDEVKQTTFSQRKKESSHDYRYFPDPDLPKLKLSELKEFDVKKLAQELPELPWQQRTRYQALSVSEEYIEMFISDERFGGLFDEAVKILPNGAKLLANYIGSDVAGLVAKQGDAGLAHITPNSLSRVIDLVVKGDLSSRGAKDTLAELFTIGGDALSVAEKYMQKSDTAFLQTLVQKVLAAHPSVVAEYKAGKEASLQFLIGQAMRESKGAANPTILKEEFVKTIQ